MSIIVNTKIFIERAKQIHGNKYIYDYVDYKKARQKVKIICIIHGVFEQTPNKHLQGQGCPKCAIIKRNDSHRYTLEEIISKMKNKHNEKYNYDLVKYISIKDKIKIICHTHGIFEQTADDHLSGKGCPKCAGRNKTTEEFIQESKKIHGDKYIYENIDFTKLTGLVTITCKKCGRFQQLAHIHLKGHGCPKCIGRDKTTEEFIQESKKIHGDKYIYDKVEYKKSDQKVDIICINHGVFTQTPSKHIKGRGCPKCKSSHGEQKIQMYLDDQNIEYIKEKTFRGCRNKNLLRFDFYLPEYNMCIEFDGKQHHEPFSFNRPRKITPEIYDEFIDLKKRDNIKNKYCTDNNIKLLRISYIEINKIECILNNFLNNIIHRQS